VLVVEDNVDGAESVRLLLEAFGHQVVVAHTGADALDVARTARPEIVLCDIGLPGAMDGYAVARALRGEAGSRVRLVALSGYGQREDKARALAAGFDRHVTKPLDPREIDRLIDELA
jgi:CheY-like chemotaxis protein